MLFQDSSPLYFHTIHSTHSYLNKARTLIMETYWCTKKNDIVKWIYEGIKFDQALIPCIKDECNRWYDGECVDIRKAGK